MKRFEACPTRKSLFAVSAGVIATLLAAAAPAAIAGAFSVTPVRIYMAPRDRAVAITIVNEGDTEVALQADLNNWSQKADGSDELTPTEDLILSPPILKLAPRARQVVRLALLKPADASRQLTYRLIMREVPEAIASRDQTVQVPVALALSMPVFITPPVAKRAVKCELVRVDARTSRATCANTGTAYAQVRQLQLRRGEQVLGTFEGGTYILPGARKTMDIKSEQDLRAGAMQLAVSFDDGKAESFEVNLP
jgi:fimbrial chaperone protein